MKRSTLILFFLMFSMFFLVPFPSMASDQEDLAASGKFLVSKLKPLAELLTSDQPSVENAVKLLGGKTR